MNKDLDAYRNWQAPGQVAEQAIEAYRRAHVRSGFPIGRIAAVGLSVAATLLIAVLIGIPMPERQDTRVPAPAALSLSRLQMPVRPEMTLPMAPPIGIPKLHQISVDFDIQMPEEAL